MSPNKWTIFVTIFVGYATYAYTRKAVSYAVPSMLKEGYQREHVGLVLSIQNLAYLISKFLGGILSDKLSSNTLFGSGLLVSGLATILFSEFDDPNLQLISWFINGLAQGLGWPAIAKLLKNWFEPSELGTWWSLASASSNLSGCFGPFLFTILTKNYNWRSSMMFSGVAAIGLGCFCYIYLEDNSMANNKNSKSKKKAQLLRGASNLTMKSLFTTPFIWIISICYLLISTVRTGLTDWSQMFLMNDMKLSSLAANNFSSSIELGGLFGGIIAGFISDRLMRKDPKGQGPLLPARGHPRMFIAMLFNVFTIISIHLLYNVVDEDTPVLTLNAIAIMLGGSVYGQIAIYGIVATESVVSDLSGSAHAIAALCANFGSMLAGYPLTVIAGMYNWSKVILIMEFIGLGQAIFMFLTCFTSYHMIVKQLKESKKTK